jgi:hypothetical protein
MDRTTYHLVRLRPPANHRTMTNAVPLQTPLGAEAPARTVAGSTSGHPSVVKVVPSGHPFPTPFQFFIYSTAPPEVTTEGVLQLW